MLWSSAPFVISLLLGYPFNRTHCKLRRRGLEKFGYVHDRHSQRAAPGSAVHAAARARAPTEPGAPPAKRPSRTAGLDGSG